MSEFEVYRIYDPAIDFEKSDVGAYAVSRDTKHLVFRDGSEPVRFKARRLRVSEMRGHVLGGSDEQERAFRAFECGVVSIKGKLGGHAQTVVPKRSDGDAPRILPEELDRLGELGVSPQDMLEVGRSILEASNLPLGYTASSEGLRLRLSGAEATVRGCHLAERLIELSQDKDSSSPSNTGAP